MGDLLRRVGFAFVTRADSDEECSLARRKSLIRHRRNGDRFAGVAWWPFGQRALKSCSIFRSSTMMVRAIRLAGRLRVQRFAWTLAEAADFRLPVHPADDARGHLSRISHPFLWSSRREEGQIRVHSHHSYFTC